MKIINLKTIILFLVFLCGHSQSALFPKEEAEVQKILTQVNGYPWPSCQTAYFQCSNYNSSYQTITQINFGINPQGTVKIFDGDFSVFTNVVNIFFSQNIYSPTNFFQTIQNLTLLNRIYIGNNVEVTDNFVLPQSLLSLELVSFYGNFHCKWINKNLEKLWISESDSFSMVGDFSSMVNGSLKIVQIPVPKTPMPLLDIAFPEINTLIFNMKNVSFGSDPSSLIPSSYFGTSFSSKNLNTLEFYRTNSPEEPDQFFELPDFTNLSNLISLKISADYFSIPEGALIDFSQCSSLKINILKNYNLFENCFGCLKFGEYSQLTLNDVTINLESTDYSNLYSLNLQNIGPMQKFVGKNFNFKNTNGISIKNSQFYGDLTEELCWTPSSYVTILYNLFNGTIPSCYLCTLPNSDERTSIIPNQFNNFYLNSSYNCENFKLDPIKPFYLVNTFEDKIKITGSFLGFTIKSLSPLSEIDYYGFSVPNEILTINIPSGNGKQNHTFNVTFVNDEIVTIVYSYIQPTIISYDLDETTFYGLGFNFVNDNNNSVTINGETTQGYADFDEFYNYYLYFDTDPFEGFVDGQSFDVYSTSAGTNSETVSFVYYSSKVYILNDSISLLNSTGTTVTVIGSFYTSNVEGVKVLVGDVLCTVDKVSNTSLTYSYPGSDKYIGTTDLQIDIYGKLIKGQVNITFVDPPTPSPTTPSPTTPSVTPSSTPSETTSTSSTPTSPNPSSSLSSEEVSSSIKSNISFSLVFIIFGLLLLQF